MECTPAVGFVGFGEAASCFASGLSSAGVRDLLVYCRGRRNYPPYSAEFRGKIEAAGASPVDSIEELVDRVEVIFSAVLVSDAEEVGRSIATLLRPGQLLVDVNATTPGVKRSVARQVADVGGEFVDGNLMGAVSIYGDAVELYCSGNGAERFKSQFEPYGLRVVVSSDEAGVAAAVKMLRSVVTKGMEALIIEAMTAARRAGIPEEAFQGIVGPMDATRYSDFAVMCIKTDPLHSERRAVEMEGVVSGLREVGVHPIMTLATVDRLYASARLGLRDRFDLQPPKSYLDVLDAYEEVANQLS